MTAFFSLGFRPFFLGAGLWAGLASVLWLSIVAGHLTPSAGIAPLSWHWHEMLFGFAGAAMAGFVLTAVPSWTGRPPLRGAGLAALFALWVAGRFGLLVFEGLGPEAVAGIDISFFAALVLYAGWQVYAARNWRNLPIVLVIAAFAGANIMFHLEIMGTVADRAIGLRLGISVILMLIGIIGGRIVPNFTANWLREAGASAKPVLFNRFDGAILIVTVVVLLTWTIAPDVELLGAGFLVCGALHAVRLARWHGWLTWREPLVAVLHAGYAWLPLGFALMGLTYISVEVPVAAAYHALTAGAMGTMIAAVMTRASLGHTGRPLVAGAGTTAIFGLIITGALLRVVSAFTEIGYGTVLGLSGAAWAGGYLLFVLLYGPMMFRSRADEG